LIDAMELHAARHGCKVCGKSFPCGRSLGGHMRSHLSLGEATADADDELKHESADFGRSSNGVVGYGLRENSRKKTRQLSDFAGEEEEDGESDGEHKACRQCGKLFGSWRSLFGHMRSHASARRDRDEDGVYVREEFVPEETDAEEVEAPVLAPAPLVVLAAAPKRKRRTMRVAAAAPAPTPASPPVLSGIEKDQEDVALCLLMLSRDTGLWSSPVKEEPFEKENDRNNATKKDARIPKNGHAHNSCEDSALVQYGDAKIKSGGGVPKLRKRSLSSQQCQAAPAPKRTRYECPGCGKVFSSYQALGGHRASHKRINISCSAPKAAEVPAPEPSAETYTSLSALSASASPDSVAVSIGGDGVSDKAEAGIDQERHNPATAAGFLVLDLNFPPPAPAEEA
jgi:hypothetical protein